MQYGLALPETPYDAARSTYNLAQAPLPQRLSELCLSDSQSHTQLLMSAILRELSQSTDFRWLCLVGAPLQLSQQLLKQADLHKERILLLNPKQGQSALDLACETLRLGKSHTLISWLKLDASAREQLNRAAHQGDSHCLNILLR